MLRQADPKRYLFGILRNKITDRLRRRYRTEPNYADVFTEDIDELLFSPHGHWLEGAAPARWHTPEAMLESDQLFLLVDLCVN